MKDRDRTELPAEGLRDQGIKHRDTLRRSRPRDVKHLRTRPNDTDHARGAGEPQTRDTSGLPRNPQKPVAAEPDPKAPVTMKTEVALGTQRRIRETTEADPDKPRESQGDNTAHGAHLAEATVETILGITPEPIITQRDRTGQNAPHENAADRLPQNTAASDVDTNRGPQREQPLAGEVLD